MRKMKEEKYNLVVLLKVEGKELRGKIYDLNMKFYDNETTNGDMLVVDLPKSFVEEFAVQELDEVMIFPIKNE